MNVKMLNRWQSLRRRLVTSLKLVAFAAAAGGAVYWLRFAPVSVSLDQVTHGDIVHEVMGTGTLEAHFKSTISPKISGRLHEVLADQGDQVEARKPLIRLDNQELTQQVEMAEASVTAAQAAIDRLAADQAQAHAIIVQAENDFARTLKLSQTKTSTLTDLDKAKEALGVARAGVSRSDAALAEGRKQVLVAERTLAYRQALLDDTIIVAPFDGLIVQRFRDPGDIAVPGSPVLSLISTKELWITAWVDETEMSHVSVGQPARVVFRSEPDRTYGGEVTRLGRQADRETREFTVDVRTLELPKNWAVGQRAEVYIKTASKTGVTLVRAQFLRWRDGKPGVFVREGQYAAWRDVTLGLHGRESIEVVSGLEPGDWVLVPTNAESSSIEGRRISAP